MKTIETIFIIEDDPISSFVIKLALQGHAAFGECKEFKNGKVAVDFLLDQENHPELILLDINMPIMDGWEFLEQFSDLSQSKNTPVIMLTSSINPDDIAKAEAHPLVKGFLSKPLNDEKLEEILQMACN